MSERVTRMVQRDRNHPSIIIWSPGMSPGMANHDALYRWLKTTDPTRPVQYEGGGASTAATDIVLPDVRSRRSGSAVPGGAKVVD